MLDACCARRQTQQHILLYDQTTVSETPILVSLFLWFGLHLLYPTAPPKEPHSNNRVLGTILNPLSSRIHPSNPSFFFWSTTVRIKRRRERRGLQLCFTAGRRQEYLFRATTLTFAWPSWSRALRRRQSFHMGLKC